MGKPNRHVFIGFVVVLAIIALFIWSVAGGYEPASDNEPALWIWLGLLGLMLVFLVLVGHGMKGLFGGILVDERNRMSLSRLQMSLWTVLVLSAYLTAFLANIADERPNPLDVTIPKELWLAMGISITSLVGSKLVTAEDPAVERRAPEEPGPRRTAPARWSDLFAGDFKQDAQFVDLTKVQMFFFTLVLVLGYAAAVGHEFVEIGGRDEGIGALPKLDEAFVILLGISHAGYLTRKAVGPEGVRAGRPRD